MDISKGTFREVVGRLDLSRNESDIEVEAIYNSNLDRNTFCKILKYYNVNKKSFSSRPPIDSIDIFGNDDIRLSIYGNENIKEYCLKKIYPKDDLIEIIRKKRVKASYLIEDYDFRINTKKETNIEVSPNDIEGNEYRVKKRYSFIDIKKDYKVDLTITKSARSTREVFTKQQSDYELEIEILNDSTSSVESIAERLFLEIQRVLYLIHGSNTVIKRSLQSQILNSYYELVTGKPKGATATVRPEQMTSKDFLSYKPVSLEYKNIKRIEVGLNDKNIFEGYAVTDKADGERHLLYIDKGGAVYLMNDRFRIENLRVKSNRYKSCLVDGEYIQTDQLGNKLNYFMGFDVYFINGKDKRGTEFISKDDVDKLNDDKKPGTGRLKHLQTLMKDLQSLNNTNDISFRCKRFLVPDGMRDILSQSKEILNSAMQLRYNIDGLIYQPMKMSVGESIENKRQKHGQLSVTWPYVFKWKPPEENTIDMLVKFDEPAPTSTEVLLEMYVFRNGGDDHSASHLMLERKAFKKTVSGRSFCFARQMFPITTKNNIRGVYTNDSKLITNGTIVEFAYLKDDPASEWKWHANRIRYDKSENFKKTNSLAGTANAYHVAKSIFDSITLYPISASKISGDEPIDAEVEVNNDVYYSTNIRDRSIYRSYKMKEFHNKIKQHIISKFSNMVPLYSLLDVACGKAGDGPKYGFYGRKFHKVLGLDVSLDNIFTAEDSALKRYYDSKDKLKEITPMAFFQADFSKRIPESFDAADTELAAMRNYVWDLEVKDSLPNKVKKYLDVFRNDLQFDVISCQFAVHYFFENERILETFCENINKLMKPGGFFIGTCFDGKKIVEALRNNSGVYEGRINESIIWNIQKKYAAFDENSIEEWVGKRIQVYVESIGQVTNEYLVNFDLLESKLEKYGIRPFKSNETTAKFHPFESDSIHITKSRGSFEMFHGVLSHDNFYKNNDMWINGGEAMNNWTSLNSWYIFRKD